MTREELCPEGRVLILTLRAPEACHGRRRAKLRCGLELAQDTEQAVRIGQQTLDQRVRGGRGDEVLLTDQQPIVACQVGVMPAGMAACQLDGPASRP